MLERHKIFIDEPFGFEAGGSLDSLELVYHSSAREYVEGERVVWICHALTGNSNPEDWWPDMVGEGKLIDPEKVYVVCVNMLCSPYGSSSPASINPATGKPYMLDFPKTTIRDIVRANILVRKHLGINHIDVMLGPSIGGFQTPESVIMEPDVVSEAIFLATSTRVTPWLTAFNESQRMAMRTDPTFLAAESLEGGKDGLATARSIALISYRNFDCYNDRQSEPDDDTLFANRACTYQQHQGEKMIKRFDAYCYWYLTNSLDSQNVGRGRGGVNKALEGIKAHCSVISIDTDTLFPPKHGRATVAALKDADFFEIKSLYGHDGFLLEYDQLSAILKPIFNKYLTDLTYN